MCCIPTRLQVKAVFGKLLAREGLDKLPVYAFGASSGGAFALALGAAVPLAGVIRCAAATLLSSLHSITALHQLANSRPAALYHCNKRHTTHNTHSEIMAFPGLADLAKSAQATLKAPYPPTAFIHMPRDSRTAALVAANAEALKGLVSGSCVSACCAKRGVDLCSTHGSKLAHPFPL